MHDFGSVDIKDSGDDPGDLNLGVDLIDLSSDKGESHSSHDKLFYLIEGFIGFSGDNLKAYTSLIGGEIENEVEKTHDADLFF